MTRSVPRLALSKFASDHQADGTYQQAINDHKFAVELHFKSVRRRSEHDPKSQAVADYVRTAIRTYATLAVRELGDVETITILQEQLAQLQSRPH